jgi:hypothetical protein
MEYDELVATELAEIIIRLVNFRAVIAPKVDCITFDSALSTLCQLQSDLKHWESSTPPSWKYDSKRSVTGDDFNGMSYHSYSGFSVAASWNQYRIAQCLVSDLILTCLNSGLIAESRLFGATEELLHLADRTIQQMCNEICASVPYFFGRADSNGLQKLGVGALEIMWGLSICGNMKNIPEEQRLWAVAQLERIGHEMGIPQALKLASLVTSNDSGTWYRSRSMIVRTS